MHIRRTSAAIVVSAAALALVVPGAAQAASPQSAVARPAAATTAATPFTARIASVQHSTGRIVVVGTGRPGAVVSVSGATLNAGATVAVKADGSWRAVVTAPHGEHSITVSQGAAGRSITLTAIVDIRLPMTMQAIALPWDREVVVAGDDAEPGATVVVSVDGVVVARTKAKADGSWFTVAEGLAFGTHRVSVVQRFDGTQNGGAETTVDLDGSPTLDTPVVDVRSQTISLSGTAPEGTTIELRDPSGVPIETLAGETEIPVDDYAWHTTIRIPGGDYRQYGITAVTRFDGADAGSARNSALIPITLRAEVTKYTAKKVVITGRGEPGAVVSFTDANGAVVRDADGAAVIAQVERGDFTRTLDPRLVSGRTLALTQTLNGKFVGEATVTF
ncbi:Ig-like domain-containing protein [Frondihabitans australicus]|uniref:Uncharacterized protein n=1 Tax=Frondihabitans australicus TaxID=386892 RepID=A0A495ILR4_9MICO|nr:Ig-like domain-containing protein [Frondihabitans australicus]RKR76201.1 hypothetical protein C8E83_3366 [Frondihabitans australicus]